MQVNTENGQEKIPDEANPLFSDERYQPLLTAETVLRAIHGLKIHPLTPYTRPEVDSISLLGSSLLWKKTSEGPARARIDFQKARLAWTGFEELHAVIDANCIYPSSDLSAYCLDLLDNGSLMLKYNSILGSRLIARFDESQMQQIHQHIQDSIHAFNENRPNRSPAPLSQQASLFDASLEACETPADLPLKSTPIADNLLSILRAGTIETDLFRLPPEQLDPKIYKAVNAVLKDLGGKWKGGKTQAHVFEEGTDRLDLAISTGRFFSHKDFGFFPTPDDVAEELIQIANLHPGQRVLEPSAGTGRLAKKVADIVGPDHVNCVEIEPTRAHQLRSMGFAQVTTGDFLKMDPQPIFDAVIMNPPFGRGLEFLHVEHAMRWVRPGGTVTAIVSPHYRVANSPTARSFREKVQAACDDPVQLDPGRFKSSGTTIATDILHLEVDRWPGLDRDASDVIDAPAFALKKSLAADPV